MKHLRLIINLSLALLAFSCTHLRSENFNARHYLNHRLSDTKFREAEVQNTIKTFSPTNPDQEYSTVALDDTVRETFNPLVMESDSNSAGYFKEETLQAPINLKESDSSALIQPQITSSVNDDHNDAVNKIYKYNKMGFLLGTIGFILIGLSVFLFMLSTIVWILSILIGAGLLIGAQAYFIQTIGQARRLDPHKTSSEVQRKVAVAKTITVIGIVIDVGIQILLILRFF